MNPNNRIRDILYDTGKFDASSAEAYEEVSQAAAAIRDLILEEVIGSDEPMLVADDDYQRRYWSNKLRAEQRQRLAHLENGGSEGKE